MKFKIGDRVRIKNERAPEPIKLYCVKALRVWLTKGKVYESTNGWIPTDDGERHLDTYMRQDGYLVPLVNRPAKVGEWVYILHTSYSNDWQSGDIAPVITVSGNGHAHMVKDTESYPDGLCYFASEYLVLDGYQPEPEYYSGKVVCVENHYGSSITIPDLTPGKVYDIVNGVLTDDTGYEYEPYKTLDDICAASGNKFIEFKGE